MVFGSSRWPGLSDAALNGGFVLGDHRFKNFGDGEARKVRNNHRGGEGETEPDQIMGWIANHGLIKVADFNFELALRVGDRAKIGNMTAAAGSQTWPCGTAAEPSRQAMRKIESESRAR